MTPIDKITQQSFLSEDFYTISYFAYDTIKKKNCILTFSKLPTSWDYSINYE